MIATVMIRQIKGTYWKPSGQNMFQSSSGLYPSFHSGKYGWDSGVGMVMRRFAATHFAA